MVLTPVDVTLELHCGHRVDTDDFLEVVFGDLGHFWIIRITSVVFGALVTLWDYILVSAWSEMIFWEIEFWKSWLFQNVRIKRGFVSACGPIFLCKLTTNDVLHASSKVKSLRDCVYMSEWIWIIFSNINISWIQCTESFHWVHVCVKFAELVTGDILCTFPCTEVTLWLHLGLGVVRNVVFGNFIFLNQNDCFVRFMDQKQFGESCGHGFWLISIWGCFWHLSETDDFL